MENHLAEDKLAGKIPSSKRKQIHEREKQQAHKYNCISSKREEENSWERLEYRHTEEKHWPSGSKEEHPAESGKAAADLSPGRGAGGNREVREGIQGGRDHKAQRRETARLLRTHSK